jgi:hypothetical protein
MCESQQAASLQGLRKSAIAYERYPRDEQLPRLAIAKEIEIEKLLSKAIFGFSQTISAMFGNLGSFGN